MKRTRYLSLLVLLVSFAILYRDTMAKLVRDWWIDANYSHGFLVVPVTVYLAWERRREFLSAKIEPAMAGFIVVVCSLGLLLVGVFGAEVFTTEMSMIGTVAGAILFLFGWARLRVMLFPLLFLLLMVPLPAIIFNQIALPLQFTASGFAEAALRIVHIPVLREGNVIHLSNISLEVEEACSGIRSLVSLLTLGIVYGYFMDSRCWMRVVLGATTIPVAILTNGFRVAGTGAAAYHFGSEVAEGFLHAFSGWFVFVAACLLLFAIHQLLAWCVSFKHSWHLSRLRRVTS
jgi:exosortase